MTDLLPPNATEQERALSEASTRLSEVPVVARDMWDPQTCPVNLLPWLAWALSVDEWNPNWTEQQKRDTIAASFNIHSSKGTLAALKSSLSALGYDTTVTEWYQLPNDMDPYTFNVDIEAGYSAISEDIFDESSRLINQVKNTRSHLSRLRVSTNDPSQLFGAAAQVYGIYCATGGSLSVIGGQPEIPVAARYFAVGNAFGDIRVYKIEGQTFTLLDIPDIQPSSTGSNVIYSIDFSPNAEYMVVACNSSPRVYIYKRNGDSFYKLPDPAQIPSGVARGGARFSPDGNFLAVGHDSGGISVYQRNGDVFTKLPNLSPGLTYGGYSVAWSPDGNYLATCTFDDQPQIYLRNGTDFSKIDGPSEPLPVFAYAIAFSPVSGLVVCAHNVYPYVSVSIITDGVHTRLPDPSIVPLSTSYSVAFNPDGNLVAVGSGEGLFLYSVTGTTLTRITNPSGTPAAVIGVAFNHDGSILTLTGASPTIATYAVSGTTLTPISNPSSTPTNSRVSDYS